MRSTMEEPRREPMVPRKSRGQSMVEVALILPIVIIVITGIGEFSWMFWNFIAVSNASYEGARIAAVGYGNPAVEAEVKRRMIGIPVTTVVITVCMADGTPVTSSGDRTEGNRITVQGICPYEYLTVLPKFVPGFNKLTQIKGQSTAAIETATPVPL